MLRDRARCSPRGFEARKGALRVVRSLFSPLLPDDYLELVNPLWSTQELRGRMAGGASLAAESLRATRGRTRAGNAGKLVGRVKRLRPHAGLRGPSVRIGPP